MGLGGISLTQLIVILAIVLVVFGTKRVKTLGGDLGGAINGFRRAMYADDQPGKGVVEDPAPARLIASEQDSAPEAPLSTRIDDPKHS